MYSARRSISLPLPELSAPPFPRRSYQRHRTEPRTMLPPARPVRNDDDESPQPPVTRIFGYTLPAFLLVLILTLLCAVLPDLRQRIPVSHATPSAPVPARATESWAYGLRGR
jgi:hypothetical protein